VSTPWLILALILGAVAVYVTAINIRLRRLGYSIPGRSAVRCSKGHLFETTWIEGGSLKAVRLGPLTRYQRCPVGRHWAIVHPVRDADLTDGELAELGRARPQG